MSNSLLLNPLFSTTRRLVKNDPKIVEAELKTKQNPKDQLVCSLFSPESEGRKGEGGLRACGYFKKCSDTIPLITVITVVFNGEEHLEETILSVIKHPYENIEYIIIDGGSTDSTLDIVRKYEHAIDYWVSEKDKGIYDAMNKGASLSSGVALIYMNSGDLIIQKGFSFIIKKFTSISQKSLNNFIVYGENIWRGGAKVGAFFLPRFLPAIGRLPSHQTMLIPRIIQLRFPYNLNFPVSADQDFKLRLYNERLDFFHVSVEVCLSLPGGISQSITSFSTLKKRSIETYSVFARNCCLIWAATYTLLFFLWNLRRLLKSHLNQL